jgi:hypothetical protein
LAQLWASLASKRPDGASLLGPEDAKLLHQAVLAKCDIRDGIKDGVVEDKVMIEAQQRNIDLTPGMQFAALASDRGVALFNRLTEKLAREEAADATAHQTNKI